VILTKDQSYYHELLEYRRRKVHEALMIWPIWVFANLGQGLEWEPIYRWVSYTIYANPIAASVHDCTQPTEWNNKPRCFRELNTTSHSVWLISKFFNRVYRSHVYATCLIDHHIQFAIACMGLNSRRSLMKLLRYIFVVYSLFEDELIICTNL